MDYKERKARLHESIAQYGADIPEGAVLTGWVMVTEWIGESGDRFLARCHADGMTNWAANGFFYDALHGDWTKTE